MFVAWTWFSHCLDHWAGPLWTSIFDFEQMYRYMYDLIDFFSLNKKFSWAKVVNFVVWDVDHLIIKNEQKMAYWSVLDRKITHISIFLEYFLRKMVFHGYTLKMLNCFTILTHFWWSGPDLDRWAGLQKVPFSTIAKQNWNNWTCRHQTISPAPFSEIPSVQFSRKSRFL